MSSFAAAALLLSAALGVGEPGAQNFDASRIHLGILKCFFGYRRNLLLGHHLTGDTIEADPAKLSSVASMP